MDVGDLKGMLTMFAPMPPVVILEETANLESKLVYVKTRNGTIRLPVVAAEVDKNDGAIVLIVE